MLPNWHEMYKLHKKLLIFLDYEYTHIYNDYIGLKCLKILSKVI